MSSLAEQALEHTRQRLTGQPRKAPTSAGAKISITSNHVEKTEQATPAMPVISTSFVPSGPISQRLFLEGRAWAVDMVASMRSEPAPKVVERLAGATAGKPPSYAAGVQSVINVLQDGVVDSHPASKPVIGTELEARPCA